jgi:lysylphosphatidylglycerol synthetase-like protein (DUF2156 family)
MELKNITIKPDRLKENKNDLVYSYMTLRNLIGFCGMILPFALAFTTKVSNVDKVIEPSISDYYYTSNGDLLVVILCLLGTFLFTYKGYNIKENILSSIAAFCGIGIAFSPTATKYIRESFSVHTALYDVPTIFGIERHLIFAALFFIILSLISLIFFPKTDEKKNTRKKMTQKDKRNIIFKLCGWIMIICVVILAIYFISDKLHSIVGDFPIIFSLETIAIEAFAISWLTKGETIYPDGEHYLVSGYKIMLDRFGKDKNKSNIS